MEHAQQFLGEVVPAGWREDREWAFAVQANEEDGTPRFAGTVSLRTEGQARAEVAYGSHPWVRGRGVMERALNLLLDWGFEERGLKTVIWWANKGNWASRKLAWRLGFSCEGTVPQWLPQRGELRDAWVGALLSTDKRAPHNPWYDVPRIEGRQVVLRPHRPADAVRVQEACLDERTRHWLHALPDPYTLDDAEQFLEGRRDAQARGKALSWAVADPQTDELVANISLFDIKPGREGEIGYWTHPAARGRGVMTEACGLVLRHAFVPEPDGGLGLRRVILFTAEENAASRRVAEANGFVAVGRERQGYELPGSELVNTICYDMLVSEYVAE
jgi:RimJ/RimL family protein N-acetyltransferase